MLQPINVTAGGAFTRGGNETRHLSKASLLAGAGAATAIIRQTDGSGNILAVLGAGAGLADHWTGPVPFTGTFHVTVTGAPTAVVVYEG